jgi:hypothetical protein
LLVTGGDSPVRIIEDSALPGSLAAVARDDVQVHLGFLVQEKSEIELVRGEPPREGGDLLSLLGMQIRPL